MHKVCPVFPRCDSPRLVSHLFLSQISSDVKERLLVVVHSTEINDKDLLLEYVKAGADQCVPKTVKSWKVISEHLAEFRCSKAELSK